MVLCWGKMISERIIQEAWRKGDMTQMIMQKVENTAEREDDEVHFNNTASLLFYIIGLNIYCQ